jgi:hypothetical protein
MPCPVFFITPLLLARAVSRGAVDLFLSKCPGPWVPYSDRLSRSSLSFLGLGGRLGEDLQDKGIGRR